MSKVKAIVAMVTRVRGSRKGTKYLRYFKSESDKASALARMKKVRMRPSHRLKEMGLVVEKAKMRKAVLLDDLRELKKGLTRQIKGGQGNSPLAKDLQKWIVQKNRQLKSIKKVAR